MERAKPVIGQRSSLATTAEELLLRQPSRRSPAHSGGERIRGGLDSPNLLCTRPDVYIEGWSYAGRRWQGACAVWVHRIGSYPSGSVENNRAPDVHRAECVERRAISVELEALHNGFRYEVPTEVFVPVEGPQIQAP